MGEFAVAELAVQMQCSLAAAAAMMADGLDLRHRLPLLWAAVLEATVEAWKARKIAARLRSLGLPRAHEPVQRRRHPPRDPAGRRRIGHTDAAACVVAQRLRGIAPHQAERRQQTEDE